MVKMAFIDSSISPRRVSIDAAIQVAMISAKYRQFFPTRTVVIFWTHVLLSAGLNLLLDLPADIQSPDNFTEENRRALRYVGETLDHLSEISVNHYFADRCILIIRGVAKKEGLLLPHVELKNRSQKASNVCSHPQTSFETSACIDSAGSPCDSTVEASQALASKRLALSIADRSDSRASGASEYLLHTPILLHPHATTSIPLEPAVSSLPSYSGYQTWDPAKSTLPHAPYHVPVPSPFWSPLQGHGLPIYNQNTNMSPMNVSNLVGHVDVSEQLRRDGFEMSETWGHDPMFRTIGHVNIDLMRQDSTEGQMSEYQHSW